ncbi:hypothetical protein COTS27_01293 [Spirochaetota bacterium]|nr:hypothetical protein COTS27_01293 [Spirochaetota bacterium]
MKLNIIPPSRYAKEILIVLVVTSCFVRLYWLFMGMGSSHYSYHDEVAAVLYGEKWLYYSHAMFSSGQLPGPWQNIIFWLLIRILPSSPLMLYLVPMMWGLVEIILIYIMILKWSENKNAALIGAALSAYAPWSLQFSYTFWNPYPVIPLMTLTMIVLYDVLHQDRSRRIFWLIVLIAIMPFFHMMSFFAAMGIVGLILYEWRRISLNYRYGGWGLLVGILLYVPFIYFDAKNNFMILRGYIAGDLIRSKVEVLKVISNHLIIGSHEISRFVGYNWKTYAFFLNKYYGTIVIPFLAIGLSVPLALYAWILFFKRAWHDREGSDRKLLVYMGVTILSFSLTFQAHELRYVNVTWAILFYVLALGITALIEKYKQFSQQSSAVVEQDVKRRLIGVNLRKYLFKGILIFYILNTFYLAIVLPHYYRYPNYQGNYRFIPSILYFVKIEDALLDRAREENNALPDQIRHGAELIPIQKEWNESLWSFFYDDAKRLSLLRSYKDPYRDIPQFFIETDFLESELYLYKEQQIRTELSRFLNGRNRVNIVTEIEEADATVAFISKEQWALDEKPEGYAIWGEFSNGYMIGKFLP